MQLACSFDSNFISSFESIKFFLSLFSSLLSSLLTDQARRSYEEGESSNQTQRDGCDTLAEPEPPNRRDARHAERISERHGT
jgi:hypothetical protein